VSSLTVKEGKTEGSNSPISLPKKEEKFSPFFLKRKALKEIREKST